MPNSHVHPALHCSETNKHEATWSGGKHKCQLLRLVPRARAIQRLLHKTQAIRSYLHSHNSFMVSFLSAWKLALQLIAEV